MDSKNKRAVIWTAVSSERQAGEDKISLEEQELACRHWCDKNGYSVIRHLSVDGYSRSETDILELLDEMAAQKCFAYHDLREMWKRREFDVLVAFTHSRLGRSRTVHSWVIENVLKSGAQVYILDTGWIDKATMPLQIAMGGFSSAGEIERLKKYWNDAAERRIEQGLHITSKPPFSHIVIRDEKNRAVRLQVDESKRRLWDDVITLLLEGVNWSLMEKELYHRFGHIDEKGDPISYGKIFRTLTNPMAWGHSARHFRHHGKGRKAVRWGDWIFEPGHEIPPGVIVHYNVPAGDAIYKGDQAEIVKAEMRRRAATAGQTTPDGYMFTGLFVCGGCGCAMTHMQDRENHYYMCSSRRNVHKSKVECSQKRLLKEPVAIDFLTPLLAYMIETGTSDFDIAQRQDRPHINHTAQIQSEIDTVTTSIRQMIVKQAAASAAVQDIYQTEIDKAGERLTALRAALEEVERQQLREAQKTTRQQHAFERLLNIGIDRLWEQHPRTINQILMALAGERRFYVIDGQPAGLTDTWRKHPKKK